MLTHLTRVACTAIRGCVSATHTCLHGCLYTELCVASAHGLLARLYIYSNGRESSYFSHTHEYTHSYILCCCRTCRADALCAAHALCVGMTQHTHKSFGSLRDASAAHAAVFVCALSVPGAWWWWCWQLLLVRAGQATVVDGAQVQASLAARGGIGGSHCLTGWLTGSSLPPLHPGACCFSLRLRRGSST